VRLSRSSSCSLRFSSATHAWLGFNSHPLELQNALGGEHRRAYPLAMSCNQPDSPDDVTASPAYQWLRVLKVALGVFVSFLTALKLLGVL
jgi:hypothetical protein